MTMRRISLLAIALGLLIPASAHAGFTLIDLSTTGLDIDEIYYNDNIEGALNGTNAAVDDNGNASFLFVNDNSDPNDPLFANPSEPDLSSASAELGDWLGDPGNLNGNWSALGGSSVSPSWTLNHETAIVYEFSTAVPLEILASFGVDNGLFVWLDGQYLGGQVRPGGQTLGELVLGPEIVNPGTHYLQVLREDHGVTTDYDINVMANVVPTPSSFALLGMGALTLLGYGKRKKNKLNLTT